MVRVSETQKGYSLSAKFEGNIKHFMIASSADRRYYVVGKPSRQFGNIAEIVAYYRSHAISAGGGVLQIPCLRPGASRAVSPAPPRRHPTMSTSSQSQVSPPPSWSGSIKSPAPSVDRAGSSPNSPRTARRSNVSAAPSSMSSQSGVFFPAEEGVDGLPQEATYVDLLSTGVVNQEALREVKAMADAKRADIRRQGTSNLPPVGENVRLDSHFSHCIIVWHCRRRCSSSRRTASRGLTTSRAPPPGHRCRRRSPHLVHQSARSRSLPNQSPPMRLAPVSVCSARACCAVLTPDAELAPEPPRRMSLAPGANPMGMKRPSGGAAAEAAGGMGQFASVRAPARPDSASVAVCPMHGTARTATHRQGPEGVLADLKRQITIERLIVDGARRMSELPERNKSLMRERKATYAVQGCRCRSPPVAGSTKPGPAWRSWRPRRCRHRASSGSDAARLLCAGA